jgi:hypothetical protein
MGTRAPCPAHHRARIGRDGAHVFLARPRPCDWDPNMNLGGGAVCAWRHAREFRRRLGPGRARTCSRRRRQPRPRRPRRRERSARAALSARRQPRRAARGRAGGAPKPQRSPSRSPSRSRSRSRSWRGGWGAGIALYEFREGETIAAVGSEVSRYKTVRTVAGTDGKFEPPPPTPHNIGCEGCDARYFAEQLMAVYTNLPVGNNHDSVLHAVGFQG